MDVRTKTAHQQRVEEFMIKAKQEIPDRPTLPDAKTRELRARLIIEEALETIRELGLTITVNGEGETVDITEKTAFRESAKFVPNGRENLEGIVDGCADILVVTTGCLSACGIADDSAQAEVDANNLKKFQHRCPDCGKVLNPNSMPVNEETGRIPGERKCLCCGAIFMSGYHNEAGKWVKPANHQGPNLADVLAHQTNLAEAKAEIEADVASVDEEKADPPGVGRS